MLTRFNFKIFLLIFALSVVAASFPDRIIAQQGDISGLSQTEETTPVIKDVEGLRLQMVQHTQDPYSQQIKFDLVVYSDFKTDRLQVKWVVTGVSELLTQQTVQLTTEKGQYQTVTAVLRPRGLGVTDLVATVEAFAADGTYLATASKNFGTFENGEVFPITSQYRVAQITLLVRDIALVGGAVLAIFLLGKFIYAKLQAAAHADVDFVADN